MDPHRVLGVAPNASQADIKRAYRRLAKALHPDAAGEAALPRFLELQDAYEVLTGTKVRTVRPPGAGPGRGPSGGARPAGGSQGAPGFQEPWRADPARARAAREQARTRQGWSGAGAPPGPEGSTGPARRSGGAPGAGSRGGSSGPTMGSGRTTTSSASGSAPGGRRRPSRKATLGSTSYDEAREPADRAWAGASWYGPTTGEYWHINPREYADPRKHGPGYSSRGRSGDVAPTPAPPRPAPAAPRPGPQRPAPPGGTTGPTSDPGATAGRDGPATSRAIPSESAPGPRSRALGPGLGWLGGSASDRWRRVGLALLAWPPLGLAAAAAIGQATGCSSYSVSCDSADRLVAWLVQAVVVGLLLASPSLAWVLSAGSLAALVALVPGVGILTAVGGAGSAAGGPVLAGWLAVAWLAGVAVGVRRALIQGGSDGTVPPETRDPPQSG